MANPKKMIETARQYATSAIHLFPCRSPLDMRNAASLLEDAARMLRTAAHEAEILDTQHRTDLDHATAEKMVWRRHSQKVHTRRNAQRF